MDEKQVLLRAFEQMDRSGSKAIGAKEIERYFKNVLGSPLNEQQLEDIVSEATKNDPSSGIDFERFYQLLQPALKLKKEEQAKKAFSQLDKQGKGAVPIEELVPVMQAMTAGKGMTRLSEEAIKKMLRSGCSDSKNVTLADFTKMLVGRS
ncbi:hypothetical protein AB1Y20_007774 [Prymnesium parvum]|uniref:EF-hand domain-containing protein n=1 Tax=Prymnesium parvum TaxID=97485 RepID=A0AB34IT01_PRYPA